MGDEQDPGFSSTMRQYLVTGIDEERTITIEVANRKRAVMIAECKGCTVYIKGETPTNIDLCKCERVNVVFASCHHVDVSHCNRVELQCEEACSNVYFDNVTSGVFFLPEQLAVDATKVFTTRCNDIKIEVVKGQAKTKRHVIPERFVSTFNEEGKVVTDVCRYS
eukprot:m.85848 g.85848  ORF g.85848 m.85848 type:complete len:165 (+) comp14854_c0_seq4:1605-2099(+)